MEPKKYKLLQYGLRTSIFWRDILAACCRISSFNIRVPHHLGANVRVFFWHCFDFSVGRGRSVGRSDEKRETEREGEFQSQQRRWRQTRLPRRENTAHLATNFTFTPRQKSGNTGKITKPERSFMYQLPNIEGLLKISNLCTF